VKNDIFKYQAGVGTGNGKLPEKGIFLWEVKKTPLLWGFMSVERLEHRPLRGGSQKITPQNGESG
jgi:hypothetical protein